MPELLTATAPSGLAAGRAVELTGGSVAVTRSRALLGRAAALDTGVLIVGERGADIEPVARELHERRGTAISRWVAVECTADAGGVDRALFGIAPVDSASDLVAVGSDSHLARAAGGTLFLQDVTELPAAVQARLARLARDGEMFVDGAAVPVTFRLVASALPTIERDVREHRFRADLYRRLSASRIDLAPLRERPDDIPALVARLVDEAAGETNGPARTFTRAALAVMSALPWTGNLAELRAAVRRILTETTHPIVQIEQVLPSLQLDRASGAFYPAGTLREARQRFEREYIASVLQYHGWKVADAAPTLGIQRPNLYRKARQLGIPINRIADERD
jgi:DNA-binding NtrC family response regulator